MQWTINESGAKWVAASVDLTQSVLVDISSTPPPNYMLVNLSRCNLTLFSGAMDFVDGKCHKDAAGKRKREIDFSVSLHVIMIGSDMAQFW